MLGPRKLQNNCESSKVIGNVQITYKNEAQSKFDIPTESQILYTDWKPRTYKKESNNRIKLSYLNIEHAYFESR